MRTVANWRVIMLNRSIHWGPADISRFMKRAETKVPWENPRVMLSPSGTQPTCNDHRDARRDKWLPPCSLIVS